MTDKSHRKASLIIFEIYALRHTIVLLCVFWFNYILQLCKMLNADSGPVKRFFKSMALES